MWRVDEARQVMVPLLPEAPVTFPFSLSEAPDGSLVVGDFRRHPVGRRRRRLERLSRLLSPAKQIQLLTPGAVQIGSSVYYSDFLPPDGRIFRRDLATGGARSWPRASGSPGWCGKGRPAISWSATRPSGRSSTSTSPAGE